MSHANTLFQTSDRPLGTGKQWLRVAILLAGSIFLAACSEPDTTEPAPRPVRITDVQFRQAAITARYSGEIRARHESPLAFQVGGKLLKRLVDVGTAVERGQLLATLDPADVRLDEAGVSAQLAAAQAELDQANKDLNHLSNLQKQNLASPAAVERRQDQVRTTAARLAAARATLGSYARKSNYTELRAEQAGVITAVDAEPGQIVASGQSIVRLAQTNEQEVVISVPENRLQDLRAASSIKVSLWAYPEHFYVGRLREVSPSVDQVLRTYTVKVSIPGADANVVMGMTATVQVERNEPQPVAWLPLTALTQQHGQPAVWVFDKQTSTVQIRTVTMAGYDEANAKVLGGISAGEAVITAGVHKLIAGQKVRILGANP
ncbi:efflux RND transporter periplasmic adaptor subunit [Methylomonas paludis]|uniref:Efflux RND transporter periplasmic adaptor subunit n=1 Tax=Methylomonas paludis TaxID=1173101 RepID=A0A975MQL4_9GAMM|nr:efflux RND transporter periplasmic adaptor subunit [Methylomonas paludis]QWF72238.1 efflux RND transporter periplasmic adaptor subunit [Methylomonas paludis]